MRLLGFHAVREALRARRPLQFLALDRERRDGRTEELATLARAQHVPVRLEPRAALDRLAGSGQHQGVVALGAAMAAIELEDLLAAVPGAPALLVALDGIEDPHNLGAIVRAAGGAGVAGVLLPARRSAGLTDAVARVAAGALEYVPVARVTNLVQALEKTKAAGFWIVGLDERAGRTYWEQDFTLPTVVVIGAEGRGLHELTRNRCDFLVSIPMHPGVASLNASVAAGVVLYEAVRQRTVKSETGKRTPETGNQTPESKNSLI